ncbi:MAG: 3-dehydroquinate synthase [Oscillospiraceae bacterium]|nr:3-dehydroquinate synthase [Oscillospiraceae bacterium]
MSRGLYCSNEAVSLVEYCSCDDRALYDCWFDPETKQGYNGWTPAASFEEFQQNNQQRHEDFVNGESEALLFAMIQCNATSEIVGAVSTAPGTPPEFEPDLSIRIFAPYRRQGYGTSAFALAAKYATETLGIAELHAGAYLDNIGSKKMLVRCGFVPLALCPAEKHYLTGEDVFQMDYIYKPMQTVHVPLGDRAYDVMIGSGLLSQCGALIRDALAPQKALIITDENVQNCGYVDSALQSLQAAGVKAECFTLRAGEEHKILASYEGILQACTAFGLTGSDILVALGGGVVGDLTGFAAASYRRGIAYVQIPTTLLAAVDSSVGGKTGLNLPTGKNLVGAFWQPSLVICDTETHATLPPAEYANGVAECIKYGVLWDESLFSALAQGSNVTTEQIARCVALKRDVVVGDERDTGARRLLNLGHTLGHAIEQASSYTIPHGAAVGIGMALMCKAFCPAIYDNVCAALHANHLPTHCDFSVTELFEALSRDKKRMGDDITIIVSLRIGQCELRTLSLSSFKALLEEKL